MRIQNWLGTLGQFARISPTNAILATAITIVPTACVLADQSTVPLLFIALTIAVFFAWREGWRPSLPGRFATILCLFVVWALLASAWTFHPVDSFFDGFRTALVVLAAWLLADLARWAANRSSESREILIKALKAGILIGAAIAFIELTLSHPVYRLFTFDFSSDEVPDSNNNRGVSLLVMLVWLGLAGTTRGGAWGWRLALLGCVAIATSTAVTGTAQLALLCSAIAFLAAAMGSQMRRAVAVAAALVGLVLMPWVAQTLFDADLHKTDWVPQNAQHRVHIWNFVADRALEKPLFGWGLDSSSAMPNFGVEPFTNGDHVIPLHPHNGALQIWMELGIVGVVLGVLVFFVAFRRLEMDDRTTSALLTAYLVATLVVADSGFGLWQSHWVASIGWSAIIASIITARPRIRRCEG